MGQREKESEELELATVEPSVDETGAMKGCIDFLAALPALEFAETASVLE